MNRITKLALALGVIAAILIPAGAANATPQRTLTGFMFCSGDVLSPGAWISASWGRMRVCVSIPEHIVEGYVDDTLTDGSCVTAEWNEFATTSSAFKVFPAGTYVGSTRSCGAIAHFVANVSDVYNALWKIRIYRSNGNFRTILDTHTARLLMS